MPSAGPVVVSSSSPSSQVFSPTMPLWLQSLQSPLISFLWLFTSLLSATPTEPPQRGVFASSVSIQENQSSCTQSSTPLPTSDWLIEYGDTVPPALKVKLEHVWTHNAIVHSVKFSPAGNYLAAALGRGNGKTYIYSLETTETIW